MQSPNSMMRVTLVQQNKNILKDIARQLTDAITSYLFAKVNQR
jgi:NADH dehydrogenase FAD-containing subunit